MEYSVKLEECCQNDFFFCSYSIYHKKKKKKKKNCKNIELCVKKILESWKTIWKTWKISLENLEKLGKIIIEKMYQPLHFL